MPTSSENLVRLCCAAYKTLRRKGWPVQNGFDVNSGARNTKFPQFDNQGFKKAKPIQKFQSWQRSDKNI